MVREVVGRDPGEFREFDRAKRPKRLPTVLTRDEVKRVLAPMDGTHGLMARLLYGTGMRLMECVRLRIKDVDFARGKVPLRVPAEKDKSDWSPRRARTPAHAGQREFVPRVLRRMISYGDIWPASNSAGVMALIAVKRVKSDLLKLRM